MATIPERIRLLRESMNISQAKLAEMMGSNQSSINRYEHGQAEVPNRVLLWYADYFDVSLDYVFGRTNKPQGIKYDNQPDVLKRKISNSEDFREFIEACFDPRSPMNAKLKELMFKMAEEGD